MRVTLMTDASVCHETEMGAYGIWVVSNRSKNYGSGVFVEKTNDSNMGEIRAVIYSLATAINQGHIQFGDTILIQADNTTTLQTLGKWAKPITQHKIKNGTLVFEKTEKVPFCDRPEVVAAVTTFDKLKEVYSLSIEFRHVKGHSSSKNMRNVSNNLCDMRAKKALREARDLFKRQQQIAKDWS